MSRGNSIIVSADPKGQFLEGIVSGTPKPGTLMEVVAGTDKVSGRFTYRAITRATGAKGPIFVLLEDDLQGKLGVGAATSPSPAAYTGQNTPGAGGDAYVSGTRCRLYAPIAGEELNMLVADTTGTGSGDNVAIGDLFAGQTTTGKLTPNASYASAPFQAMESIGDIAADYMLWVTYLGNQA